MKKKTVGLISKRNELAPDIFELWIETELAKDAKPGQFVGVYPTKESTLLPRPISICEVDEKKEQIRLVYRIAGKGTTEFSHYKVGRQIFLLGVLGNGYPLEEAAGKEVILMGGGIGIPPILQLAKTLYEMRSEVAGVSPDGPKKITAVIGYRDENMFLKEELEQYANVVIATENGSVGTKGNVMNAIEEHKLNADLIYACGPMMMLKAIKQYAEKKGIKAYISLEERMACGVGACLGCVCKTTKVDTHSHVNNARICTEGPVFEALEVEI